LSGMGSIPRDCPRRRDGTGPYTQATEAPFSVFHQDESAARLGPPHIGRPSPRSSHIVSPALRNSLALTAPGAHSTPGLAIAFGGLFAHHARPALRASHLIARLAHYVRLPSTTTRAHAGSSRAGGLGTSHPTRPTTGASSGTTSAASASSTTHCSHLLDVISTHHTLHTAPCAP
jgi:hypothetical protein